MTGGGAQRWPDYANRTKRTADEQTDMYSLLRVTPYSPTRINTPVLGTTSAAPEVGAGVSYLKTAGGSMIGPIAYYPALDTIANGRISVQQNAGAYSSYVLVSGAGTPDDLNWIDYTSFSGQIIFLQGTNQQVINVISAKCPDISNITGNGSTVTVTTSADHNLVTGQQVNIVQTTNYNIQGVAITVTGGTTFTYSDTTSDPAETSGVVVDGNIITDDGNDIVMDGTITTKGVPVLKLIFDSTAANGGTYRVVGGSGGTAGANKTLSNLDNPTSINQDLIPDGNGTRDLGSALNSWDSVWSRYIRFDDDVTAPSVGQSHKISTSALGMDFNVSASGDKFTFYFDGSSEFDIDSAGISVNNSIIVGDGTSGQGFININDSTNMVGAVNGYIYREGNDIKAFSGGVERNLSDIGSGGANTALSNLIATSINQSLNPNGPGSLDLGSDTNYWDQVKAQEIKFLGSVADPAGTTTEISRDAAGDINFGVDLITNDFSFFFNGVRRIRLYESSSEGYVDSDILEANRHLELQPTTGDPAIDGIMRNVSGDVKVYSGGVLHNFSEMAETDLNNLVTTSVNVALNPSTVGTLDLGSDSNYWDQVKAQELKILGSKADPAGTATEISRDAAGDMNFGVDLITNDFSFFINGVRRARLSESGTQGLFDVDILEANSQFVLQNSGGDPAITGVFKTNGSDVKVYSGGAVRNFSDIGGGGSNYTIAEAIQLTTSAPTTGSGKQLFITNTHNGATWAAWGSAQGQLDDAVYAVPIIVGMDCTAKEIKCKVKTGQSSPLATVHLALYDNVGGSTNILYPKTRLATGTNFGATSNQTLTTSINVSLTAGIYWLAFAVTDNTNGFSIQAHDSPYCHTFGAFENGANDIDMAVGVLDQGSPTPDSTFDTEETMMFGASGGQVPALYLRCEV